jgi:hypothetical protein
MQFCKQTTKYPIANHIEKKKHYHFEHAFVVQILCDVLSCELADSDDHRLNHRL